MRIINRRPDRVGLLVLGMLPFVTAAVLYLASSAPRLAENPNDKLLPSLASFGDAITHFAWERDKVSRFALGTRVLVFDKLRYDPQDPGAYGATITYDLPLGADKHAPAAPQEKEAPACSAI